MLVIDDSEEATAQMARVLRASGFDPIIRRVDTADAMAAALADRPWDLILAEYQLPSFTGPRALDVLQKSGLDIPFILVSGTVGEEVAVALMKAGAHDFVLKHHLARLGAVAARELREAAVRRRRRWADAALEILADAGKLAVEVFDFEVVVSRAANLLVPRLADWCIVYARDQAALTDQIAVASDEGIDRDALDQLARGYPAWIDASSPVFGEVVRTRRPALFPTIDDAKLATLARDDRQLQLLRALAPGSLMIIPQVARERVVGVLVLAARQPGRYTEADLELASELGSRFALIVENAGLSRAREEFISTAIHEIKTPLAVIKTAVEVVERLPPPQREDRLPRLLARINRQVDRLTRLVSDVLEVSRLDVKRVVLARRPTDLAALVAQVVAEVQDVSPRHQLVILRSDPVTLDIDPDRIEQVLTNLLSNAVRYSPAGGEVDIEVRRGETDVQVSVRDRGIGIPKDKQGSIFERFYRAHAHTPYDHASSLGVGLYVSRELIQRHGGRMWFESTEGVGSTFGFTLPLTGGPR